MKITTTTWTRPVGILKTIIFCKELEQKISLQRPAGHLKHSGVPVENSKGEWGKGQHELNVRYAEIVEMADRHVIYKQCLKELADQMDIAVTFMAKIDEAQAGSSCHIHMSLWKSGNNAFSGNEKSGPISCSETFQHFLGGWITYAADVMPFFAHNYQFI